jgi:hypothetical protein
MMEGPFAEVTGYVAGERAPKPTIRVTAITHRDDPGPNMVQVAAERVAPIASDDRLPKKMPASSLPMAFGLATVSRITSRGPDRQLVNTGVLRRKASSSICLTRKSATSAREMNPHVQSRGSTNAR